MLTSSLMSTQSNRRITMRDVSELAGANQASVSMVLNGAKSGGGVSDATKARIIQAAEELGYRRNASAANMKSGRSGWITLLQANAGSSAVLNPGMLEGVSDELSTHNLHLHVERVDEEAMLDEQMWPRVLREWVSDGIILVYDKTEVPELEAVIHRQRIPVVWTNVKRQTDCVFPDDEGAFLAATKQLIELGHQRITYIMGGNPDHYSTQDRRAGYELAMRSAGLQPHVICEREGESFAEHYELIRSVVELPAVQMPTAVLSYSGGDVMHIGMAALAAGLRVPEDLSIVALTMGTDVMAMQGKKVSIMRLPFHEVGAVAVRQLLHKIGNPDVKLAPYPVAYDTIRGETHQQSPDSSPGQSALASMNSPIERE